MDCLRVKPLVAQPGSLHGEHPLADAGIERIDAENFRIRIALQKLFGNHGAGIDGA